MIHASFFEKDGQVHMEMQGHALTAPKGQDLVCAAASMVAYTLAQAVQFLYEQDRLRELPRIRLTDGYVHIVAIPRKCARAETLLTFWVAQAGAYVLERNYPKAVCLSPLEVKL